MARRAKKNKTKKDTHDDSSSSDSDSSSSDSESESEMAWLEGLALDEIPDQEEYKDRRKKLAGDSLQNHQKRFYQKAESKLRGSENNTVPLAPASEKSTGHGDIDCGEEKKKIVVRKTLRMTWHARLQTSESSADFLGVGPFCPAILPQTQYFQRV